jgi:hypothetical protein
MQFSRKNKKRSFLIIENEFFFPRENWVYKFSHWKGGGGGEQQCATVTLPRKIAHKRSFLITENEGSYQGPICAK